MPTRRYAASMSSSDSVAWNFCRGRAVGIVERRRPETLEIVLHRPLQRRVRQQVGHRADHLRFHARLGHQRRAIGDLAHPLDQPRQLRQVRARGSGSAPWRTPAPRWARSRRHPASHNARAHRTACVRACSSRRHSSAPPRPARCARDAARRRRATPGRGTRNRCACWPATPPRSRRRTTPDARRSRHRHR